MLFLPHLTPYMAQAKASRLRGRPAARRAAAMRTQRGAAQPAGGLKQLPQVQKCHVGSRDNDIDILCDTQPLGALLGRRKLLPLYLAAPN